MTTMWEWVDVAVDQQVGDGWPVDGATAQELSDQIGITRSAMSYWLQVHRSASHPGGSTRYVLQARGHGRGGRWYITAGPGDTARHVARARRIAARHSSSELAARIQRDVEHEVLAVNENGHAADPDLVNAMSNYRAAITVANAYLETALAS